MAEYKGIVGTKIRSYTTNPDNPIEGEVWYNETDNVLKYQHPNTTTAGSWATTGNLNQARNQLSSAGQAPRSASLVFSGFNNPTRYYDTEQFNGATWTELNNMTNGAANRFGFGVNTAALCSGGYVGAPGGINLTESWNGTNWTEVNDMNTARYGGGSAGLLTGGLAFGGYSTSASNRVGNTETWNGTNWTEVNDLNTARNEMGSCGATNTEALTFGGNTPPTTAITESWNGTNWTEVNDLNTARVGLAGAGIYTLAVAFGGNEPPGASAKTEEWNGSNWTETTDLNAGRAYLIGGGSQTAAVAAGGQISGASPSNQAVAELWTGAGQAIGAWATSTSINTGRDVLSASGSSTAALAFGGQGPSNSILAVTENWDGSSWTEVNDINTARSQSAGFGTSTAALMAAGSSPPGATLKTETESWNGTNWTEVNDLNTARRYPSGAGTVSNGVVFGGYITANTAVTESWNGTNWTEVNDLNTARHDMASFGIYTAAIATGGYATDNSAATESWNGTNWTEVNDLNTARYALRGAQQGTSTAGLVFGGEISGGSPSQPRTLTEDWDGVSWAEVGDMNQRRRGSAGTGNATSALAIAGDANPGEALTAVEEWSGSTNVTRTLT